MGMAIPASHLAAERDTPSAERSYRSRQCQPAFAWTGRLEDLPRAVAAAVADDDTGLVDVYEWGADAGTKRRQVTPHDSFASSGPSQEEPPLAYIF
jgi:hypothetical protein